MKIIFALTAAIILLFFTGCFKENEVKVNKSGLRYFDEETGDGREAESGNIITVNFRAWTVHDSTNLFSDWATDTTKFPYLIGDSYARGQTFKFVLGENTFIQGVDEGIFSMKTGGKRTIIIPSKLAYGKQGMGPVGPDMDLKIDIELLEVKDRVIAKMWDIDTTKIKTTESGLKYSIVDQGEGESPSDGNAVMINYTGYLGDSTKFDSSVELDQPLEFVVGNKDVIDGLDEGIRLLKKGGKARLILPPSLGYKNVALPQIPANSTLIFDVELLDVK